MFSCHFKPRCFVCGVCLSGGAKRRHLSMTSSRLTATPCLLLKKGSHCISDCLYSCMKFSGMSNSAVKRIVPLSYARFSVVYRPHSPWDRGTNENTNGLLREYIPKSTDIDALSEEEIVAFFDKLNKRPRKCLGWKTPFEVFYNKVLHLV